MILLCPDKENLRIWRGRIFLFLWPYYIHQWAFITLVGYISGGKGTDEVGFSVNDWVWMYALVFPEKRSVYSVLMKKKPLGYVYYCKASLNIPHCELECHATNNTTSAFCFLNTMLVTWHKYMWLYEGLSRRKCWFFSSILTPLSKWMGKWC